MDINAISVCGLYCGNCGKFKKGKCPGCRKYVKATWCKTRACCLEHNYTTCAECTASSPSTCKHFNNFIGKFFEVVFRSDRKGSLEYIKAHGTEAFANLMVDQNRMVIKKK